MLTTGGQLCGGKLREEVSDTGIIRWLVYTAAPHEDTAVVARTKGHFGTIISYLLSCGTDKPYHSPDLLPASLVLGGRSPILDEVAR